MEPTNHPFRKENDLNQTSMIMFHVKNLGVYDLFVSTWSTVDFSDFQAGNLVKTTWAMWCL